jgi:hypothetical protein
LIPLKSYSLDIIQDTDTLNINRKQVVSILKDKKELEYLREDKVLSDSLLSLQENKIMNLNQIVASNKIIKHNQVIEIDYYKSAYINEKRKNKLIIIGSSVVTGLLLYQAIK